MSTIFLAVGAAFTTRKRDIFAAAVAAPQGCPPVRRQVFRGCALKLSRHLGRLPQQRASVLSTQPPLTPPTANWLVRNPYFSGVSLSGRCYIHGMEGAPTQLENLLYLLTELEQAVERGTIVWSPKLSRTTQRRLFKLADLIHRTATPPTPDSKSD
jgi:hypothetical protein